MARWKKPTKDEILENRRTLAERAHCGDLRLPGAIAEIRKGIGMTQEEFANMLALTRRQVAEIETGVANPTLQTLQKVGRLFGFTVGFVSKDERKPTLEIGRAPRAKFRCGLGAPRTRDRGKASDAA